MYPGSRIWVFFLSRIRIKEFKYLTQKNGFQALGNIIRVVHPWSGSLLYSSRIPDPGVKKSPDPDPQHWLWVWRSAPWLAEAVAATPCPTSPSSRGSYRPSNRWTWRQTGNRFRWVSSASDLSESEENLFNSCEELHPENFPCLVFLSKLMR